MIRLLENKKTATIWPLFLFDMQVGLLGVLEVYRAVDRGIDDVVDAPLAVLLS